MTSKHPNIQVWNTRLIADAGEEEAALQSLDPALLRMLESHSQQQVEYFKQQLFELPDGLDDDQLATRYRELHRVIAIWQGFQAFWLEEHLKLQQKQLEARLGV